MRIAVTGNIGCGKSTVMRMLAEKLPGYRVESIDAMVRALYEEPDFKEALRQQFGCDQRAELSRLAFADSAARKALEETAGRWMKQRVRRLLQERRLLLEFPLLLEMPGWAGKFDHVIAISCSDEVRRQRTLARDAISSEKFSAVTGAQWSNTLKQVLADSVIENEGGLVELEKQVAQVLDALSKAALRTRCERFFRSAEVADAVVAAYSESHRHYHTLAHLQELFDRLDNVIAASPHAKALEMAVWFHDFVYSTRQTDYSQNEARSAKALFDTCRRHASWLLEEDAGVEVALAAELILCTHRHALPSEGLLCSPEYREVAEHFLDADLAILGASAQRLASYDSQIAHEWLGQGMDHAAFALGRAKALSGFLARPHLYFTDAYGPTESVARKNLEELVSKWTAA